MNSGQIGELDGAWVSHYQLAIPGFGSAADNPPDDRRALGGAGANYDEDISLGKSSNGIAHGAVTEGSCGSDHRRGMAEAGTVVHVVGT